MKAGVQQLTAGLGHSREQCSGFTSFHMYLYGHLCMAGSEAEIAGSVLSLLHRPCLFTMCQVFLC